MGKDAGVNDSPTGHAATPALVALSQAGIPHSVHPYDHDPASTLSYGLEAAAQLGLDPAQVFKTLCAYVDEELVVAVVPVTGSLNLKALAAAMGGKRARMAPPADAERSTGSVVGGISPIGQRTARRTAVDIRAQRFDTVYVSGGRRGLDICLAPADLVTVTGATYAPLAKDN